MTRPATVTLPVPDGALPVTVTEPTAPPATPGGPAAVLVIQEAFGVNDHIEDLTRRLAGEGYLALAPHLFHRSGDPTLSYSDLPSVMPHLQALTPAGMGADLDACLTYLADRGVAAQSTAVAGFCMGGAVALWAGTRSALAASITFYGGGVAAGRFGLPSLVELAPQLQTPWLGLYGDEDQGIPVPDVEALRAAAARAPVPTLVVRYPEAGHGFHCDARPAAYHAAAAADAWRRTLTALAQATSGQDVTFS